MSFAISNATQYHYRPNKHSDTIYLRYTLKETDGAIYDVRRVHSSWVCPKGKIKTTWKATQAVMAQEATECEKVDHKLALKGKKYRRLHSKTLVKAAPPKPAPAKPVVPAPVKLAPAPVLDPTQAATTILALKSQVDKLTDDVAKLQKQLAAEKADKDRIQRDLSRTMDEIETLQAALNILLRRKS